MKDMIISSALTVFDEKGFHKAGIRDIAKGANCSLAALYYYFENKETLFEEAVCASYERIVTEIDGQLPGIPVGERYYFAVMQRQKLTPEERRVFRIARRLILGLDGHEAAVSRLRDWERVRLNHELEAIEAETGDGALARVLLRVVDSMVTYNLLCGEALTGEEVKQELEIIINN